MKEALGLVEIKGLATSILVADTMAKTANVTITQLENTKGLGWMTIKVIGNVGAVNAAVNAGKQIGLKHNNFIASKVIARPSYSVERAFCQIQEQKLQKETVKDTKEAIELTTMDRLEDIESVTNKTIEVVESAEVKTPEISQNIESVTNETTEVTELVGLETPENIEIIVDEMNNNNENLESKPKTNTSKSSRRKNKNADNEEK